MAGPVDLGGILKAMDRRIAELERRLRGRSREGVVVESDPGAGLYRVQLGEGLTTPWIRVQALSSGGVQIMAEPTVGQSVTVTSESGDLTDAQIALSSFSDAAPRPHGKSGEFAVAKGGVKMVLSAEGVSIVGDVSITGRLDVTGNGVSHNGVNIGDTHTHSGVTAGASQTGTP
ncbi:hypothetical protein AN189_07260 [Loktanella sp. 3ANDIMAR09]|uniref:phage baseplate assembly protein V n=1 Tax=Loktanella sp. 3ANDIMAR09 TaxID=1225657 RepID=UPI0006FAF6DC|nr:phage baseplate assembly protein V [Loktanella sp. 3ANDIMAR09]KQI68697.1 hypothetical protein AN189_07260 [Loktanella sp. 3ANDIMAR09]